tara:strand:- start:923 stop:1171 length:249 start_codon:yes stop_codon:yes gene_type:complete
MDKTISKIVKILNKKKPIKFNISTDKNYDFVKNGHIDSLSMIAFVIDLENEFKIKLSYSNINSKNFGNIMGLSKLINSKIKK